MAALLGLLVNPIAGMGGRVGLHGTDGRSRLAEARRRGAIPVTAPRAARALQRVASRRLPDLTVLAPPGTMGFDLAASCGLSTRVLDVDLQAGAETTAADTDRAARMLAEAGAELVLFAGGDGTAADIVRAVGERAPVLGIPSGVKMRSGVFAPNPEAAGELAADFLALALADRRVARAEVVDLVELGTAARRAAPVAPLQPGPSPAGLGGPAEPAGPREPGSVPAGHGGEELAVALIGEASVPSLGAGCLPGAKNSNFLPSKAMLEALCQAVADELAPGTLYFFGPGSTTGRILEVLGLPGSPLGVDAVLDGALLGHDLSEEVIVALMEASPSTKLVLGVIGGQGFLLGRGNQQLSPRVLARLGSEDLVIISSAEKLAALQPPLLRVDVGDHEAFSWVSGYRRVRVGPSRFMMMRVAGAA